MLGEGRSNWAVDCFHQSGGPPPQVFFSGEIAQTVLVFQLLTYFERAGSFIESSFVGVSGDNSRGFARLTCRTTFRSNAGFRVTEWAGEDSNLRPSPCQGDVLTRLRRRFKGVLDDEPCFTGLTETLYQSLLYKGPLRYFGHCNKSDKPNLPDALAQ